MVSHILSGLLRRRDPLGPGRLAEPHPQIYAATLIDPARATDVPDHARLESILDLTDALTAVEQAR
jgi:hypothetical protein